MKMPRPSKPLFLLLLAGLLWAVFLALLTLTLRWLGTTFPWVVLTSLVSAWGVWTVVIARSRRRLVPAEMPGDAAVSLLAEARLTFTGETTR